VHALELLSLFKLKFMGNNYWFAGNKSLRVYGGYRKNDLLLMDTEAQACAYDRGATSSSFRGGAICMKLSLAHNGSAVFGAKRPFLASTSCVKVFRSTFKAMSFKGLHWMQKLGSGKASFGPRMV